MLLYIVRHAEAEKAKRARKGTDDPWHVTKAGERWAAHVTSLAQREFGFRPEAILSSPVARALETAGIVRSTLGAGSEIVIEEALQGEDVRAVYRAAKRWNGAGAIAVVTHWPLFPRLLADLLGAESSVDLQRGGIACIQCEEGLGRGRGRLEWLLPPRQWFDGQRWT